MSRTLLVSPTRRGAYPSIREAVEAAPDGAVISIEPGEYAEALVVTGKAISPPPRAWGRS